MAYRGRPPGTGALGIVFLPLALTFLVEVVNGCGDEHHHGSLPRASAAPAPAPAPERGAVESKAPTPR